MKANVFISVDIRLFFLYFPHRELKNSGGFRIHAMLPIIRTTLADSLQHWLARYWKSRDDDDDFSVFLRWLTSADDRDA